MGVRPATEAPGWVASDLPLHRALVAEAGAAAGQARGLVRRLRDRLSEEAGEAASPAAAGGLSFLSLKNLLMSQYLSNLSLVLLRKSRGQSVAGHAALRRLVSLRTVLEKMRPIEQKLKYQIDKAVQVAESGCVQADDPLHFKPNPGALQFDEDDEDEAGDTPSGAAGPKYVVPKQVPAFFQTEPDGAEREEVQAQRSRKAVLSRALIEDLKRQHLDTPEEVHEREDVMRKRHVEAMRERTRYEEDNFMRLPVPKKMKHARRQMNTMGTIADEITGFGGASEGPGAKRKSGGRKGSGKRKFRK